MQTSRLFILNSLLMCQSPLDELSDSLKQFDSDTDIGLATLTGDHISNVLTEYTLDKLTDSEVHQWADLIELRDDIGLPAGQEGVDLQTIIQELANPTLFGTLSNIRAHELLNLIAS